MAGEGTKRIIDLTEAAETQNGDYFAIDSTGRGTRKLPAGVMATAEDLSAEQTARQTADATLDGKITAETQDRLAAENAFGEQITALDEKTEADAALIQNPVKTLSGALCSFTDGAEMPAKSVIVNIEPQQSGTGTPSPDNVRQISGWESVNLHKSGVNVWDEEWEQGGISPTNGANTNNTTGIRSKNLIPIVPNTEYNITIAGKSANWITVEYDENGNYLRYRLWGGSLSAVTSFTTRADAYYMRFQTNTVNEANTFYGTTYNDDISINYPSTDTEYEPYTGTTTPVSLGRTVYGGALDVVSGVLTVDRAIYTYTNIALHGITQVSSGLRVNFNCPSDDINRGKWSMTSSTYPTFDRLIGGFASNVGQVGKGYAANEYTTTLAVETEAEAKALLEGMTIAYYLATPTTYTLTPTQINTLLGENNVWADSGDVEITYRRDISIVINNLESALNG